MSEWISVKDQLPIDKQDVLTWDGETVLLAQYRPESQEYRWDVDTFGMREDEVTHWAPLPLSPAQVPAANPADKQGQNPEGKP